MSITQVGHGGGSKQRGFTLVELMVSLSIVVILGTLAAPSLRSLLVKIRLNGVGSQFTGNLLRARTEAVNRNACTVMCLSTTTGDAITSNNDGLTAGPRCAGSGTNWQQGWIVFFLDDCTGDPKNQPARPEDYIAVQAPVASDYKLEAKGSAPPSRLSFDGSGRLSSQSAVLELDLYYQTASSALTQQYGSNICIDTLGRSRTVSWNQPC